jgi:hypothetical protein
MGKMQLGSGSEWHLLRMLGRHRQLLNKLILTRIRAEGAVVSNDLTWLDFPLNPTHDLGDGEHIGVDFLGPAAQEKWKTFWPDEKSGTPNRKGQISWDAIGCLGPEWLLIEAKANETEFNRNSPCGAQSESRKMIIHAFTELRKCVQTETPDVVPDVWLGNLYQTANRLACLHFIRNIWRKDARLVFIHFIGDRAGPSSPRVCPTSADRWHELVAEADRQLGIPSEHALSRYIHHVVVDVVAPAPSVSGPKSAERDH